MKKLRYCKVKELMPGYIAHKLQRQDLGPGNLAPESTLLASMFILSFSKVVLSLTFNIAV